jgi:hypothetical protein
VIKLLLTTSVCALVASAGFLGLAAASAARNGINFGDWERTFGPAPGPTATRDLAWPGGDTLGVAIPADVRYTQGPNVSLRVTGSKGVIDRIVLVNGTLRFDRQMMNTGRDIEVVMTAPDVTQFRLSGSPDLHITGYNHPELSAEVSGSGEVTATGATERLSFRIAGSGEGDFTGLPSRNASVSISGSGDAELGPSDTAEVRINGSGDVEVAPRVSADVHISGSGEVTVRSSTAKVTSRISGSGEVKQEPM